MSKVDEAIKAMIRAIIEDVVPVVTNQVLNERDRRCAERTQALSANLAARRARCRRSVLVEALTNGALPGQRHGRRWAVLQGDLEAWVRGGKKVTP